MAEEKKMSIKQQAKQIKLAAESYGIDKNFFFKTTFDRYLVQISILAKLEKKINDSGEMVTKEYVKGRQNLYANPAIKEYNNTTNSANSTAETLMKILKNFESGNEKEKKEDPLLKALQGEE